MSRYDYPSPNAIPVRKSSTGVNSINTTPEKAALRPVPEADWMSPGHRVPGNLSSPTAHQQHQHQHQQQPHHQQETHRGAMHSRHSSVVHASDQTHITWSNNKEKILRGPFDYLVNQPGKNIRKQFITAFNAWLHVPEESVEIIHRVVAILHTASLLVDDVEDSSELRRGIPVAHAIYGVAQTLNSANYMYFVALQELVKLNNATALHIYTEEMCNLHRGQGMDLFWRDTLTVPTEEEYLEMVGNKTGGLFRLAIKLMQAESTRHKDCVSLVGLMGIIFQIRDDYMNLWATDYSANKGMCEDLTEGKFSFPVIHSIRANPSSLVIINILKQRTRDETVKRYAVGYMEQTGSFAYCRKVLGELIERARQMIEEIDDGDGDAGELFEILDKLKVE